MFSEKLIRLRREKGYSQEQLADRLAVSRQSVSKWESGSANPEISKIIALAELFDVSVDYLVRDHFPLRESGTPESALREDKRVLEELGEIKQYIKRQNGYEYKSKAMLFGLPLVHIHFSRNRLTVAKGIVAIGNVSVGVVSIGLFAAGIFSIGPLALGLLFALGGLAVGGVAIGGLALGALAVGGLASGVFAVGGLAKASSLAMGGVASGKVAVGHVVQGQHTFLSDQASAEQIHQFLLEYYPSLRKILDVIFSSVR